MKKPEEKIKIRNGDKLAFPNGTIITFINIDMNGKKRRTLDKWAKEYSKIKDSKQSMLPDGYKMLLELNTYLIKI